MARRSHQVMRRPVTFRALLMRLIKRARQWIGLDRTLPWFKRYQVGRGTYGTPHVLEWGDGTTLQVGSFCSIATGVTIILGGDHRTDWITTYPFPVVRPSAEAIPGHPRTKGNVIIGHDVWLGTNVTILSGVRIGNGAVVGACSVVTRDVDPYAIVAGNPAKLIRKRFSDREIAVIERLAWWNWPDDKLDEAMPLLLSGNVYGLDDWSAKKSTL